MWAAAVSVTEEPELAEEIRARASRGSAVLPVSVSDLLALRRAFWRRRAPSTPIAEDRRGRMEAGRSAHARLIDALPREGAFEVRIRRDGIAGRIDLLSDVPVEVKTGAGVGPERLVELRPDHVEQVAMYCALTDRPVGRIVTLSTDDGAGPSVEAVDLPVGPLPDVAQAMRARADALREAVRCGAPTGLPACRWFGRRCEFEEARVCDCTGAETGPSREILDRVGPPRQRPEVEARWRQALASLGPAPEPPAIARFRDLLYPRRTYFEQTAEGPPAEVPGPAPAGPVRPPGPDPYARLIEAVEGGPVGEVARLPPVGLGPEEEVVGFRTDPFLVRTSRAWSRIRPAEALARFPQYALELGFRCAASGRTEGRVFLSYERAEKESDRFQVLRYRFDPLSALAGEWSERSRTLRAARSAGRPESLPPCPGWMFEECPYRSACGCGEAPGRSHR